MLGAISHEEGLDGSKQLPDACWGACLPETSVQRLGQREAAVTAAHHHQNLSSRACSVLWAHHDLDVMPSGGLACCARLGRFAIW